MFEYEVVHQWVADHGTKETVIKIFIHAVLKCPENENTTFNSIQNMLKKLRN